MMALSVSADAVVSIHQSIIPSFHRGVTGKGQEHQADSDFSSLGDDIERWLWSVECGVWTS